MAAFYAARSIRTMRLDSEYVMLVKAAQLAERAPEHDRLVIKVARHTNDYASRLAAAESLAVRYPTDPDGHLALATVRFIAGDFVGAIPHARRVIAMDSLELGGKRAVCTACDAFDVLIWTYRSIGTDSFPAVERTAREWIKRQPEAALAWRMLAEALAWRGQRAEALNAFNKVMQVEPTRAAAVIFWRAVVDGEKYAEAERVLRDRLHFNERDGLDWLIHVLRHQGRPSQALELAREGKRFAAQEGNPHAVAVGTSAEAQILFELGRFHEAAKLFQASIATPNDSAYDAYAISWVGQHAATAWAAAGDTVRVAQLAASIERVAHRASHGLAWHAAPYVRGLLWQARGQPARAAAEFRAAIYSPTFGYTRANFELARTYLSLGKAQEAIRILREVLGGTSTGVGFYVTRTETHELLARAFDAAQQRDSAAVHYRAVVAAWKNGDTPYRARADSAQRKLNALQR
jgi:tetratricopeptide (TPR) repeat protein